MPQPTSRKKAATGRDEIDLALVEASSVVAAIVVSADGTIRAANARMRRFLGSSDEVARSGKPFVDYFVHRTAWDAWRDAARAGRSIEVELRSFDGVTKVFRGDVRVEGEGADRRFVGILVDGDDNKALRAAAQHSARMEALGSLTAGVAHDFNNLLTVLVGNLYLVGEEVRERPRVFEKLKAARDAGKRGTELIKQLMTFARREELYVGTIDPAKVVGELLPLLRRALGPRITLETTLQEQAGTVRASVAQLESVVVNLAVNARDAIEGKGRISIEVTAVEVADGEAPLRGLARGGSYVSVIVRDTGAGIAPDALHRVFEPFFSTKRERGGTGLGLSMVRWFAESSGGCAAIESVVGQGTVVTLLLARQQAGHAVQADDKTMPLSTLPPGTERVVVLAAGRSHARDDSRDARGARLPGRGCGERGGPAGRRCRGANGALDDRWARPPRRRRSAQHPRRSAAVAHHRDGRSRPRARAHRGPRDGSADEAVHARGSSRDRAAHAGWRRR